MTRDIVVTWPKTKPLADYLAELAAAVRDGLVINYRVARLPKWDDQIEGHGYRGWPYGAGRPRCFMVHEGAVRGYVKVIGTCWRDDGEVEGWPAGWYIVRDAFFVPVTPRPMKGFQGWRWYPR